VFLAKKNTCFYAALICGTVAASCNIQDKTLLVYNNVYSCYSHMCCITMLYVTNLKKVYNYNILYIVSVHVFDCTGL
jgi:hypothetical protein